MLSELTLLPLRLSRGLSLVASIGSHVSAAFLTLHFDGSGLMATCLKARTRAPTCLYSGQGQHRARRLHTVSADENKDRLSFHLVLLNEVTVPFPCRSPEPIPPFPFPQLTSQLCSFLEFPPQEPPPSSSCCPDTPSGRSLHRNQRLFNMHTSQQAVLTTLLCT